MRKLFSVIVLFVFLISSLSFSVEADRPDILPITIELESIDIAICILDKKGQFIYHNLEKLFG